MSLRRISAFVFVMIALLLALTPARAAAPQRAADQKLRVFFFDVEGGQSTLFITPAGQSLLIDTGWADNNGRDADRIASIAHKAGLNHLDYVLITHYHDDHVGGVPQLLSRIPVTTFLDHGPNRELTPDVSGNYDAYQKVLAAGLASGKQKNLHLKPGDTIPIPGLKINVVTADGNVLAAPGTGEVNPYCAGLPTYPRDTTENSRSLGTRIQFGKLTLVDLGDLTSDKEVALMCPANRLGTADIYIVSHHGWYPSSSPALVYALHPRVAIMDNGALKGGSPATFKTLRNSPGLENLWQLHYSVEGGQTWNGPAEFIANINTPQQPDAGNYIELTASPDGSFDVLNSRTGATKHYPAK
uniref:Beta-lactamase-like n=1 Tax=mine drainage metagenome TaxID=410659 RepID=E6PWS4_9ZZZZ